MRHTQSLYSVISDFLPLFFAFPPWSRPSQCATTSAEATSKAHRTPRNRPYPPTNIFPRVHVGSRCFASIAERNAFAVLFDFMLWFFFHFCCLQYNVRFYVFIVFFYPTMFWWDQHKCNANKYSVFICLFIYLPGCHMCFVQVMLT